MKIENMAPPRDNRCPGCGGWLNLAPGSIEIETETPGFQVELVNTLLLRCYSCSMDFLPRPVQENVGSNVESARKKGRKVLRLQVGAPPHGKFSFCPDPEFIYDEADYFFIPGLSDSLGKGEFCPVFFDSMVLERYSRHPGYFMDLLSSSHGLIGEDGGVSIPFGINGKGLVFMWLGDLDRLPVGEQYYLRSHNVPSDHNLEGELYRRRADLNENREVRWTTC